MPKKKNPLAINLNLLKPQSNPEKLLVRLIRWLLSSGRFIFVFVEALVLIAFATRFKLDADLASKKEAIEEQIPYIESLKPYEILIRNTQLKLSTIENITKDSSDWPEIFKKIADQTPSNVKITNIKIVKDIGDNKIDITGESQSNTDLNGFITGLKKEPTMHNVSIADIGFDQEIIKFTISVLMKKI
ncbi:MAG: PilN domain-containing protein [Candidatus Daviesbacteria bacterium]|nr:PilN domain-containing protein [Candidatus Daviesbacteria bacterium]